MADKKFTLLELHVPDASLQVGPRNERPGADEESAPGEESAADETETESGGSGGSGLGALLGLGLLAAAAFVARKLLGGDDFDDLDVETFDASEADDLEDEGVSVDVEDESGAGGSKLAALAVLGLLALVAVVAKKLLGAGDGLDELDDLAAN